MLFYLFLLFTLMPLLELWLLFRLGELFGLVTTIVVVLLTGMLGAALARWQGFQAMFRIQNEMRAGKMPAQAIGDGVMILVAGVLLITPGVITDIVGLAMLLPPVRLVVRKGLQLWLAKHVKVQAQGMWQTTQADDVPPRDDNTVEGTVVEGKVVDAHVVDANVVEE